MSTQKKHRFKVCNLYSLFLFQSVVEVEIGTYTRFQLPHGLVEFQVDVLVLEAPPQTLHPDVVQCPPLSIHAHLNVMVSNTFQLISSRDFLKLLGMSDNRY